MYNAASLARVSKETSALMRREPRRQLETTLIDLDAIIDQTRLDSSEVGIFLSMYRSVTAEIRDAVRSGFFDDGAAMEHLAVTFADRYLDAYRRWCRAEMIRDSWRVAFEAATDGRRRMVVQHLLAGINVHINRHRGCRDRGRRAGRSLHGLPPCEPDPLLETGRVAELAWFDLESDGVDRTAGRFSR